jgi:hypothetical protein
VVSLNPGCNVGALVLVLLPDIAEITLNLRLDPVPPTRGISLRKGLRIGKISFAGASHGCYSPHTAADRIISVRFCNFAIVADRTGSSTSCEVLRVRSLGRYSLGFRPQGCLRIPLVIGGVP